MSSQHSNSDSIDFENDSELLRDALDGESVISKSGPAEQAPDQNENVDDVV